MATYYVSTSGNDSNPGTIGSPWRTIQKAANTAAAGDTVNVRGGTYAETIEVNVSGSSGAFITFQSYTGETAIIDGTTLTVGSPAQDMIFMEDRSYIRWQNFEICNFRTSVSGQEPQAIMIQGTSHHIEILNNNIHHIETNVNSTSGSNGHGILVIGSNGSTAITDIVIDGNHIHDMRTGFSETLTLNGNVTNFRVTNNVIHDCNNIAIDMAGHYGACPNPTNDQARNGLCSGNLVYNIDSFYNPAYGGSFTTGGGSRGADGIYVDGGKDIIIERNIVKRCNIGIEMASEHAGLATSYITVRSNIVIESHNYGIAIGGYDPDRGITNNCKILNNTLFKNGTLGWGSDLEVQFDTRDNVVKNNVFFGNGLSYFIHNAYVQNTGNVVDYNLYFLTDGPSAAQFMWKNVTYSSWSAWQGTGNDSHGLWADPQFVSSALENFHLLSSSPAIGQGDTSVVGGGELDVEGGARSQGAAVEMGAYEVSEGGAPGPGASSVALGESLSLSEGISISSTTAGAVSLIESVSWSEGLVGIGIGSPAPPPPPPVPTTSPFVTEPITGPRVTHYDHLGAGLVRPFVRASHGDLASNHGVATVLSNVGQIFGTRKGTLPWRPEFGSNIAAPRHRANTPGLRELAATFVREGLSRWEPRVNLRRLTVDSPKQLADANQVALHAAVSIDDGQLSLHEVVLGLNKRVEAVVIDDTLLAYSIAIGDVDVRLPRGLAPLVPPPMPGTPPLVVLGAGLVRPITRGRDFTNGSGNESISSNVGQVLGTIPGTLPWRPEFGCRVHQLRHRANTPALRELARLYVEQAVTKWEPHAQVTRVELLPRKSASDNLLNVRAVYRSTLHRDSPSAAFDIAVK
jgi:phage baseplate assembly protein W